MITRSDAVYTSASLRIVASSTRGRPRSPFDVARTAHKLRTGKSPSRSALVARSNGASSSEPNHAAGAAAVDHSPEMVRLARELNADAIAAGRLEIARADAVALPFADGGLTVAAMTGVLGFLPD